MPNSSVTVNFNTSPPNCSPDQVPVNHGVQDGIQWTANQTGYTFTGVEVSVGTGPTGDFGSLVIDQTPGANPRSRMTISDACNVPAGGPAYLDYKYTLRYTDSTGAAHSLDPTIRNKR